MNRCPHKTVLVCTLLVIGSAMASCKTSTSLKMTDTYPPTFTFHRGLFTEVNSFPLFIVEEIHPDNLSVGFLQQRYAKNKTVWKIVPDPKVPHAPELDKLPPITYGTIPNGFIQETPSTSTPPPFEPGKVYEARGAYVLMPDAIVRFKVEADKITPVVIPGQ